MVKALLLCVNLLVTTNGVDTVLANPVKTKIIAQAKLKDDKVLI